MEHCQSDFDDHLEQARSLLTSFETRDELARANDLINSALQLRWSDVDAWICKSQVMSALGDDASALAAIEMARTRAPRRAEVQYWRAAILSDSGRYRDALRAIDRAFADLDADDSWLIEDFYCEKALAQEALGQRAAAIATYNEGLRACPDSQLLSSGLDLVHREKRRATFQVLDGGLS